MNPKPVLIITGRDDVHADYTIKEIRRLGGDVIRLNTEDLATQSSFAIVLSSSDVFSTVIHFRDSGLTLHRDSIDTVWYRKPYPVRPDPTIADSNAKNCIRDEFDYFLRSFYGLVSDKRWVNPFWALRHAGQKLPNLEVAARLGLTVPKTLITNDPERAKSFAQALNWNLLVKTFDFSGFVFDQTEAWHCFARKVEEADFHTFADSIAFAPTFLQEYIPKLLELRVTVIGRQVFTAAIHSQEQESTKHDWRAIDPYKVRHTVFALPQEIEEKLLAFNRFYSLATSTFDIVLKPDETFCFLECNPNGQWYWIEELTCLPIAASMAQFLLKTA